MSGVVVPSSPNRSIITSIVLSILVTLVLWFIQSVFRINSFWVFLIYAVILFALFYFVLPRL